MGRAPMLTVLGCQRCVVALWLAVELVDDGRAQVESIDEESDALVLLGESEHKLSGAPLPCCLQDPVPKGCRCFLVKANGGALAATKKKTSEAKQKAPEARRTAKLTKSKEKQIKRTAKALSNPGVAAAKAKKANKMLKQARKDANRAMRKAKRAATKVRKSKKLSGQMKSKVKGAEAKVRRAKRRSEDCWQNTES